MKDVKTTLLDRRCIRRYEREDIPSEMMGFIYDAIRNTPTSYNGQQFSVIDIDDQPTKEKLYELTGQKQIKTCRHFLLFCADYNKISLVAEAKGIDMPDFAHTADGVIVGIVDATLAMMSALTAARVGRTWNMSYRICAYCGSGGYRSPYEVAAQSICGMRACNRYPTRNAGS